MHLVFIKILQIWNHVPFIWKYFGYQKELQYRTQKMAHLAEQVSIFFIYIVIPFIFFYIQIFVGDLRKEKVNEKRRI